MMKDIPLHLHKFGGSSLADADCYRRVAHILLTHGHSDDLVVVSAAGKTTNALYQLAQYAVEGDAWHEHLDAIIDYQQGLIEDLLSSECARSLRERLSTDKAHIISHLNQFPLTNKHEQGIICFGEIWSARLLSAYLVEQNVKSAFVDARDFLVAQEAVTPIVDEEVSAKLLSQILQQYPGHRLVITGFICKNQAGETLLLGRNGSDYSATLITRLANYHRVTIWTDVQGIYNADPNKISDAKLLHTMSLQEADKLARLGSPVLHNRSLGPLKGRDISLAVRSSYAPHTEFTLISPISESASQPVVTSSKRVSLLSFNLSSPLNDLLTHLASNKLVPLAYWQGYQGKHELAFVEEQAKAVIDCLISLQAKFGIGVITHDESLGLVALVSSNANDYRYSFSRLLSRHAKPLYADGSSLVTLLPSEQVESLTQKVHRRCAGPRKRIGLVLFGVGNIGQAWLSLFAAQQQRINETLEAQVDVVAILSSQKAMIKNAGISINESLLSDLKQNGMSWTYESVGDALNRIQCDEIVAIDISASSELSAQYPELLKKGIHLVSANKIAGSSSLPFYRHLKEQLDNRRLFWRYNASVGAGLPVQHTVNDLIYSGDTVTGISGIFSGTLCWLFEHFDGTRPFSELVLEAKDLGITEPDPRDDLSGKDMQRKLLILGRELGLELELEDVALTSLVPKELESIPLAEFFERITELDGPMQQALEQARQSNQHLRYIAELKISANTITAKVDTQLVCDTTPFIGMTPGNNIFIIESEFYRGQPIVIQGPGAGREVTAAAVQSDVVEIIAQILHE